MNKKHTNHKVHAEIEYYDLLVEVVVLDDETIETIVRDMRRGNGVIYQSFQDFGSAGVAMLHGLKFAEKHGG